MSSPRAEAGFRRPAAACSRRGGKFDLLPRGIPGNLAVDLVTPMAHVGSLREGRSRRVATR